MKKIITIVNLFIIIISFTGCFVTDEGFHSTIDITINNYSSYNVTFYSKRVEENEELNYSSHGPVASQASETFSRPSGYTYDMYCVSGENIWGPEVVYIDFGQDYMWTINDPATPTPTPEPTLTPAPTGVILINNNSLNNVAITISSDSKGILNAGTSITYSELTGDYNLYADAVGSEKFWEINISLTEQGYEWNLEENLEVFPSENHRIWNFENNYEDHLGVDDWDGYGQYNTFSATIVKFGGFSFSHEPAHNGYLGFDEFEDPGNDLSIGGWVYVINFPYPDYLIFGFKNNYVPYAGEARFRVVLMRAGTVRMECDPNLVTGYSYRIESHVITTDAWHYISISYDSSKGKAYLTVDNFLYEQSVYGTWFTGNDGDNIFHYTLSTNNYSSIIDEAVIVKEFIDPNVFIQHYNRNLQWNME